eukprot:Skav212831  [mRNA]  locus=scaffold2466:162813:163926:- [translate_table: standard]
MAWDKLRATSEVSALVEVEEVKLLAQTFRARLAQPAGCWAIKQEDVKEDIPERDDDSVHVWARERELVVRFEL